jgi:hypothetical protein
MIPAPIITMQLVSWDGLVADVVCDIEKRLWMDVDTKRAWDMRLTGR